MVKEVRSRLNALMTTPVGTSAMVELDREMKPILEDLMIVGPCKAQHPKVKHLFNWLRDPRRTVDEFIYVIGPLAEHVRKEMDECFIYLGKIAIEALAVKSPVLEGQWEVAAWVALGLVSVYYLDYFGFVSDHTSAWIINVISDADICPNVDLRIEFMGLIASMHINDEDMITTLSHHNKTLVFEALMSISSELEAYFERKCDYGMFSRIHLSEITLILEILARDQILLKVDEALAVKLQDVKISTVLAALPIDTELKELYTLIALLNFCKSYRESAPYKHEEVSSLFHVIISNFPKCCQMPQLIFITASCIVDEQQLPNRLLKDFTTNGGYEDTIKSSLVCQEIFRHYALCHKIQVLDEADKQEEDYLFDPYPMISSHVNHYCIMHDRKSFY